LHSPLYREKYKGLLKKGFPKIPIPRNDDQFNKLTKLGGSLKQYHLLDYESVNHYDSTFPVSGSDVIDRVDFNEGKVFINDNQYFGKVDKNAWDFYVGGYQPAQRWLKERIGRKLQNQDIEHYQKMIKALLETIIVMSKVDKLVFT
jgi:predicted helicase